ncbi:MAG TPA: sulfite exporter TauE/SafE family protein [Anaerolineales bacterium]|nr:sulfite exporter TauE/SafE family protein [Anaerolineales bacterium]
MKKLRRLFTLLLTLFLSFALVPAALAHPLGNFTINQYVGFNVSRETVLMDYVVDMAEIPAFQEIAAFDSNGNGQPDASEFAGYPAEKCTALQPTLNLLLDNQPLTFTLASSSVDFPAGVGGLPTLRLSCTFQTSVDLIRGDAKISFHNSAFPERIGWREIVVANAEDVSLQGHFSTTSQSNRLTNYPQDLVTSPLDERSVEFVILSALPAPQTESVAPLNPNESSLQDRNDAFTRLILMDEITLPTLFIALAVAFIWGAMHAMTPGHGKTIVGAYLVGSRGTPKHALYLGLTTTITHTLGVFAFGLITVFAAQYIVPEKLFPWMTLLSGLFVVGIGVNLFFERFKTSGLASWIEKLMARRRVSRQIYAPALQPDQLEGAHTSLRYVVPALSARHQSHHFDDHRHGHEIHSHQVGHHHDHVHIHEQDHHGHTDHSHRPPEPETVTWRSLLALGVSGGLLPCPSALVILLGAIALNRIGFGLILVLAFSLGLAGALTAIGLAFIYAGKFFERFPSQGRVINILPALSALFISLIGLGIVGKALMEIGVL